MEDIQHFLFHCELHQDLREKFMPRMGLRAAYLCPPFLRRETPEYVEHNHTMLQHPSTFAKLVTQMWERRARLIERQCLPKHPLRTGSMYIQRHFMDIR